MIRYPPDYDRELDEHDAQFDDEIIRLTGRDMLDRLAMPALKPLGPAWQRSEFWQAILGLILIGIGAVGFVLVVAVLIGA